MKSLRIACNLSLSKAANLADLEKVILTSSLSSFDSTNVSLAINRLGRNHSQNRLAIDKILNLISKESLVFQPRQLSMIAHGLAKAKLTPQLPDKILLQINQTPLSQFDHQSLVNLLSSFANFQSKPSLSLLTNFSEEVERRQLSSFSPRGVSNVLWAFAKLDYVPPVSLLEQLHTVNFSRFSSQDISLTMWALAKMGSHQSFDQLSVVIQAQDSLCSFSLQSLTQILYALAKTDIHDTPLISLVTGELSTRTLSLHDLATVLWSLAKLRVFPLPWLNHLHSNHAFAWSKCTPQELSTLVWSMATLGFFREKHELENHLLERHDFATFSNQDLANLLWGLAHFDILSSFDALIDEVLKRPGWDGQSSSMVLWACATSELKPFSQLCDHFISHLDVKTCNAHALSTLTWSLACLGHENARFASTIAKHVEHEWQANQASFTRQTLLTLCWSFSCLDAFSLPAVQRIFQFNLPQRFLQEPVTSLVESHQLLQARLAWSHVSPTIPSALLYGFQLNPQRTKMKQHSSGIHMNICNRMQASGVVVESECLLPHCGLSVDMFLPQLGWVVEVNGPHHYFKQESSRLLGRSRFKQRLLERSGYHVVMIQISDELGLMKKVDALIENILSGKNPE